MTGVSNQTGYDNNCGVDDAYGDFGLRSWGKGGGGDSGTRVQKRNEKRGGSQGSGSVYSSKHARLILIETRSNGSGSGNKICRTLNKYELAKSWDNMNKGSGGKQYQNLNGYKLEKRWNKKQCSEQG